MIKNFIAASTNITVVEIRPRDVSVFATFLSSRYQLPIWFVGKQFRWSEDIEWAEFRASSVEKCANETVLHVFVVYLDGDIDEKVA